MLTIAITGATGFIGAALIGHLNAIGGFNVIEISRKAGVDFLESGWVRRLPACKVDVIVHLAQSDRYREFPSGAEDMRVVNIDATAQLLEWARVAGVGKFIFASSGNVYGDADIAHCEDETVNPSGFYGLTKLCGEYLANQYSNYFQIINTRMFGVYGPGQKKMLIPEIIKRVSEGRSIKLASGRGLVFNPIYIDDCIDFLMSFIHPNFSEKKVTVNIAGDAVLDLGQITDLIGGLINILPTKEITSDDPAYLIGNIKIAKKLLPEKSFVNVEDGLRHTIEASR